MSVLEEVKYVSVTHTQTKQYTTNHNKKSIDCFYHNRVYFKASMKIMKSVFSGFRNYNFPPYINDIKEIYFIKFDLHYFHTQRII